MRRAVRVLRAAEKALKEGNDNCGGEPDNIYYEPLKKVRAEIKRLIATAPEVELAAEWCAGESNEVPVVTLVRLARTLRGL